MFGPNIELSMPPAHWFTLPPSNLPQILPPPAPADDDFTLKSPFAIDTALYNNVLSPALPFTFAAVYLLVVFTWNKINTRREFKPYAISKSGLFKGFVLLHNIALAAFSAVTCVAMVRAVSVSFPGFLGEYGLPGAVDSLCKISGPRGFGDAITYNSSTSAWASKNTKILLGEDLTNPDSTDVGRIWNEGLAFWGWIFYMSKFYEVVDNLIILAKGKRVSGLQEYHHAGALLCMWAGIRYMSPPIWMFVLVNAGVHFLMYSYYAVVGLGYKVSPRIKKTITTLQITQFVVGVSFAVAHLFISYSVPVSIPYTVRSIVSDIDWKGAGTSAKSAASSAASAASSAALGLKSFAGDMMTSKSRSSFAAKATSEASSMASSMYDSATTGASSLATQATDSASSLASQASATASSWADKALADDGVWFKKLLYRAAGREALAEAVRNSAGELFGPEFDENLIHRTVEEFKEEIRYYTEYQTVRCLDTDGQAFAVWFNVLYLVPLTITFLNFFQKTYSRKPDGKQRTVVESAQIAASKTESQFDKGSKNVEDAGEKLGEKVQEGAEKYQLQEKYEKVAGKAKQKVSQKKDEYDVDEKIDMLKENFEKVKQKFVAKKDEYEIDEDLDTFEKRVRDDETYQRIQREAKEITDRILTPKKDAGEVMEEQESELERELERELEEEVEEDDEDERVKTEVQEQEPKMVAQRANKFAADDTKAGKATPSSSPTKAQQSPTKKNANKSGSMSSSTSSFKEVKTSSSSSSTSSLPTPGGNKKKFKGGNGGGGGNTPKQGSPEKQ